jgi:Ca2+-transporting ATPase
LTAASIVALVIGIAFPEDGDRATGWIDGAAILLAIMIVCTVAACQDWSQERQFRKQNMKKEDRRVKVIRGGERKEVSIHDINVGDVCELLTGDQVPADGVYVEGHNILSFIYFSLLPFFQLFSLTFSHIV